MSVYRRGRVWWFKFRFQGQQIRESAKTTSRTVAREAERARRRELEMAINHIPRRQPMPLFKLAAERWLETKNTSARNTRELYGHALKPLKAEFDGRLLCDINAHDIARYQSKRLARGKSARTVNLETGTLRQILKANRLWATVGDVVKMLPERRDIGKALSRENEEKLIESASLSRAPALLPLVVVSIDTGLRAGEIRALRHCDLRLEWANGTITDGELIVSKSKTEAGRGRIVPLTSRSRAVMTLWLSRYTNAMPNDYLFPKHLVGVNGNEREPYANAIDPTQPIGSWKKAWREACERASVRYRWHDLRHTFITRLLENPNASEETIRSLAGHVAKRILERYSHIRTEAKRAAIATLENGAVPLPKLPAEPDGAQNWAQQQVGNRLN